MTRPENDVFDVRIGPSTFSHRVAADTWQVTHDGVAIVLDGRRPVRPVRTVRVAAERAPLVISASSRGHPGARIEMGEENYRRTESSWKEAGSPTATVEIGATDGEIFIDVQVRSTKPNFAQARDDNPLDNEHPDVNSDGVQIHLTAPGSGGRPVEATWLLVPEPEPGTIRMSSRGDAANVPIRASWSLVPGGWTVSVRIPRDALGPRDAWFGLDVVVNEMPAGRERRRGQRVLSGKGTGWAWLLGDRQDRDALLPMVVPR